MFEEHEFVEGIIPLHKKDPVGRGSTQILVAVVRITADTTFATSFCIIHL